MSLKKNTKVCIAIITILFLFLSVLTVFPISTRAAEEVPSGNGTEANPYIIATSGNLVWISNNNSTNNGFSGKYFLQIINITLTDNWVPIGTESNPFQGIYNGKGYAIKNIKITGLSTKHQGFFGYVKESLISNLGAEVTISGVSSSIYYIGGLVGYNYGTIKNCYTTGTVTASGVAVNLGMLAGYNLGIISECYSAGQVKSTGSDSYVGGLVGYHVNTISNCYSTCAVIGVNNSCIGGLTGGNYAYNYNESKYIPGIILNSYSTGTVTGGASSGVGGMSGWNYIGNSIINCFTTSTINASGQLVGGLVGSQNNIITNCYYVDSHGTNGFGLYNGTATNCIQQTDLDFYKKSDTYLSSENWSSQYPWDFSNKWTTHADFNNGYPRLINTSPKYVSVIGLKVNNKIYDGTKSANLDYSSVILSGVDTGDTVTLNQSSIAALFSDKNVGTAKTVTITGLALTGKDASKYFTSTTMTLTGDIAQRTVTPSVTVNHKEYDGTVTATASISLTNVINSEVSVTGTAAFLDSNVGQSKKVDIKEITLVGNEKNNYLLSATTMESTANINPKPLTIQPDSNQSKIYGENDPVITYTTNGLISGDTLKGVLSRATGESANTYFITQGTLENSNYTISISPVPFTVKPRELTITGIVVRDKIFDGTNNAVDHISGAVLNGIIHNDDVTLNASNVTATYDNKNIGNDKVITITGYSINGEKASNYQLNQPTNIKGNIIAETADDLTLEVVSIKAGDVNYDHNWTKDDVVVTLNAKAPSGIKAYQYSTDNGTNWTGMDSNILTLNQTINETYLFRAISNGEIASHNSNNYVIKVDKTNPLIKNILGNPIAPINLEQFITFSASDEHSGLQAVSVKKGDLEIELTQKEEGYSFKTKGNGQYQIKLMDLVGNLAEELVEVTQLDFENPIISSISPENNEKNVDVEYFTLIFNEKVKKSGLNGDIILFKSNGTVFETIDVNNNRIKIEENQLKIYPSKVMDRSAEYYINIAENVICDLAGNNFSGIIGKNSWKFRTSNQSQLNSILGIEISVSNEQYGAVVDPENPFIYRAIVNSAHNTFSANIIPELLNNSSKFVLTTDEAGVSIKQDKITVSDSSDHEIHLNINVNSEKNYTLIIYKGTMETKIKNKSDSNSVVSKDMKGALDIFSQIGLGKKMELTLNITKNEASISSKDKASIKKLTGNDSVLYLDINLELNNITDNQKTEINYTQNPLTIQYRMLSKMIDGKNIKVVRTHLNDIEIIDCTISNNTIIFKTDRFSNYAITYTEKTQEKEDSSNNNSSTKFKIKSNSDGSEHWLYINGYKENTFRPDDFITRAEVVSILSRVSNNYNENLYYANSFSDVSSDSWYANAVGFGSQNNIIQGYEGGSFLPEGQMTRGEFTAVIVRFKNLTVSNLPENIFNDIVGHWSYENILLLNQRGWISGYGDGQFLPDAPITRAEAVKIMNRALDRIPNQSLIEANFSNFENPFIDIANHWAYYEILEAALDHDVEEFHN